MKIAVCICTWRRPLGLANALDSIEKLRWDGELVVVVIDNDAAGAGLAVCASRAQDFRWPLLSRSEPLPGISFARNTAVEMALSVSPDFVAMIDDDEFAAPQWLSELIRIQQRHNADLVGGPVTPVFPEPRPEWVEAAMDCFGATQNLPDGERCQLHASGNFLIRSSCLVSVGPEYFRQAYAHSGGEDHLFFRELGNLGFRMHWARQAVVYETVPPDRMTLDWVKQREVLKGNVQVRIFREHAPGRVAESLRIAKTAALLSKGGLTWLIGLVHKPFRVRARMLFWRARGKITAHLGQLRRRPDEVEGI